MLLFGLGLLTTGAEILVRGASQTAKMFGVPALVIGLTIVAYGTSAPELSVSVIAGLNGKADVALGNVVGSNIFNVLFILGISALITPLVVSSQLVKLDVPVMIAVSVLALIFSMDGNLDVMDGSVLFTGLILYTFILFYFNGSSKNSTVDAAQHTGAVSDIETPFSYPQLAINLLLIAGGLVLLVWGSKCLVDSAITIAQYFGISELIIGLTIVAAGTSLPEVAASVVASLRGERDIAVGNVVGSNIFNLLGVLGLTAIVSNGGLSVPESAMRFDLPIMTAVAVACLPIFLTGSMISRWEGALFLGYYVMYTLYLILAASQNSSLHLFTMGMGCFVIPLTVITLVIVTVRHFMLNPKSAANAA